MPPATGQSCAWPRCPCFTPGTPKKRSADPRKAPALPTGPGPAGKPAAISGSTRGGTERDQQRSCPIIFARSAATGPTIPWARRWRNSEGSFKHKNPPQIIGSGYVVKSLEAALWAFYRSESFPGGGPAGRQPGQRRRHHRRGLRADRRGFLWLLSNPRGWRAKISHRDLIESYAGQLYRLGCP